MSPIEWKGHDPKHHMDRLQNPKIGQQSILNPEKFLNIFYKEAQQMGVLDHPTRHAPMWGPKYR